MPDNGPQSRGQAQKRADARVRKGTVAYTVKQVAAMSGVSVRTLHFYDEAGLLKPAYLGSNGYRFYEEPQLLALQQVLFYRELGFELKQIKRIVNRADFEKLAALKSHRKVLDKEFLGTRDLIKTIDKTIDHLKGIKRMKDKDMFVGFSVAAGDDRFGDRVSVEGLAVHCKVSARDTAGAMCAFEFTGGGGVPRHLHYEQDEWIYVLDGELDCHVGDKQLRLRAGESVFLPRKVAHAWAGVADKPPRIINVYQPAGTMEEFFRTLTKSVDDMPSLEQMLGKTYTPEQVDAIHKLFHAYGMDVLGPPLGFE
jgi:DNA-binding transcriptional MerR regulator/quercetin dioxygenase-like cupin family protein